VSRNLYFIGAGLTKALGLTAHPVPAMFDFIAVCAEYIDDPVILTTLAELENSKPYPYAWDSALARTLAPQLVGQRRTSDPDVRAAFARALRERPSESIEDLLDRTGGDVSNFSSQSADERFRYAIRRLFTIIGWNMDWNPLVSYLERQLAEPDSVHTFVSFNYDLVLERGIQIAAKGRIDLTRLYGFPITQQVTGDPSPLMDKLGGGGPMDAIPVSALLPRGTDIDVTVLKPHGSLNWLAPVKGRYDESTGGSLRQGLSVVLPLSQEGALRYLPTTNLPPWIQPANEWPLGVEPVVVTPRGAKKADRPFLCEVRKREEAAIMEADVVYILGWSVPRTDKDQEDTLRSIVRMRSTPFQKITVVNLNASVDYYRRVQELFGVGQSGVRTHNSGFREFAATA
jgi:hypothetical protein